MPLVVEARAGRGGGLPHAGHRGAAGAVSVGPGTIKCLAVGVAVAVALLAVCVGLLAYLVYTQHGRGAQARPDQAPPSVVACEDPGNWTQGAGNVLIVHYEPASLGDNYTAQLAAAVASGARSKVGASHVRVLTPSEVDFKADILEWADAVVVGTPVYNANVHPVVQQWIDRCVVGYRTEDLRGCWHSLCLPPRVLGLSPLC